jgi:putative OPT family oligopeptide transporter
MTDPTPSNSGPVDAPHSPLKPAGEREFTLPAVLIALAVTALIGATFPYIVLKIGFGPNIAVVSAFFGYLALRTFQRNRPLRWQSNLAQAAGMTAGNTAFMCVIIAAFDMLSKDPSVGVNLKLTATQTFLWITTAGLLGVFLAVPMRQHFVVDEKLPYPDGMAAGETLIILDARGKESRNAVVLMVGGLVSSAVLAFLTLRDIVHEVLIVPLNRFSSVTGFGVAWSLLSLGSGMIVGLRICANMFIGALISWVIAPVLLANAGVITEKASKTDILLWVMWPATGMMIAGGVTGLFLKWRILQKSFKSISEARTNSTDFPMRWVVIGSIVSAVALVFVQYKFLDIPIWQTSVAILLSIPLLLVSLRVLGETNWGPISALSNLMQGIFGAIVPGNIQANMVASGITGSVVAESEGVIQSYKTGDMIGSTPKYLTYVQIMAVPLSAFVLAQVYPRLSEKYGVGPGTPLPSPISQKWVGFAKILKQGTDALAHSALIALVIAVVLGVVFTVLEQNPKWRKWIPSPTGIGIGMLVPAAYVVTMLFGGLIDWYVRRKDPHAADAKILPLASGFIAGDALIGVGNAVVTLNAKQ